MRCTLCNAAPVKKRSWRTLEAFSSLGGAPTELREALLPYFAVAFHHERTQLSTLYFRFASVGGFMTRPVQ